ncbi:hypothetical protein GCM10027169_11800 [Gordonia jinhuaensis]|uniref:Putative membrane protein insertion efficiency factor n=1 Tax=Gordonia jinhuaensis TaxID=1517702 RepID=A0A916T4W5_9ACTN|nr:hypothetical protein GCM10011489_19720 [Gordonia jinhuaensis]
MTAPESHAVTIESEPQTAPDGPATAQSGAASTWRTRIRRWPVTAVVFVIELYRTWVSPMRPPSCRFYPTCSAYAVEALQTHGLIVGGWLSVVRLLKCGPWHKPGYDPVPERRTRDA